MKNQEILIVDDDPGAIRLLTRILASSGRIRFATSGEAALRLAREVVPDLILLDAEMPGMSGFEVCAAMKADPLLAAVPIVFVTAHRDPEFELSGFEHGAADFIHKPVNETVVRARTHSQLRIKHLNDELQRISTIDALTGLANRREFDRTLACEWQRTVREGRPASLLMIDVDHFKRFNDRHGHPAGDAALQAVALALRAACRRPADLVARYGGEEFALLLPETPRDGAVAVARRIVASVLALQLPHGDSPTAAHVTVSVGVGVFDEPCPGAHDPRAGHQAQAADLVVAADQALYAAKHGGRCRAHCLAVAAAPALPALLPQAIDIGERHESRG